MVFHEGKIGVRGVSCLLNFYKYNISIQCSWCLKNNIYRCSRFFTNIRSVFVVPRSVCIGIVLT